MKIINTKITLSPVVETKYEYTYDWRGDRTETNMTEYILLEAIRKIYFLGIPIASLKYFINFPNNELYVGGDIHKDIKNLLDNKKTKFNLSSIKIEYHLQEITPYEYMTHFSSVESAEQTINYMEKYPHLFTLLDGMVDGFRDVKCDTITLVGDGVKGEIRDSRPEDFKKLEDFNVISTKTELQEEQPENNNDLEPF